MFADSLRPVVGAERPLPESVAAFTPGQRDRGKTNITIPEIVGSSDGEANDGR